MRPIILILGWALLIPFAHAEEPLVLHAFYSGEPETRPLRPDLPEPVSCATIEHENHRLHTWLRRAKRERQRILAALSRFEACAPRACDSSRLDRAMQRYQETLAKLHAHADGLDEEPDRIVRYRFDLRYSAAARRLPASLVPVGEGELLRLQLFRGDWISFSAHLNGRENGFLGPALAMGGRSFFVERQLNAIEACLGPDGYKLEFRTHWQDFSGLDPAVGADLQPLPDPLLPSREILVLARFRGPEE